MNHISPLRRRASAAVTALTTGGLTMALLAGMPYILWETTGIPWPQHVTSWADLADRLSQPVTDPLMLDLLAVPGWVCWAAFIHSVVRETCWYATHVPQLLRDRGTHREHLATLPLRSSLAALCIGTLVLALLSLWRPQPATAHAPVGPGQLRVQLAASAPQHPSPTHTEDGAQAGTEEEAAGVTKRAEYVVAEGDTLWDISRTQLGDPVKWPRIYALNKDRLQSDGHRLADPDLIRPGWRLALPTAHAPERTSTPPPLPDQRTAPSASEERTPAPTTPAPEQSRPTPRDETAREAEHASDANTSGSKATSGPAAVTVGEGSVIGITAAAGLLAALRCWRIYQRRKSTPNSDTSNAALGPAVERAVSAAREATLAATPPDPDPLVTRRTPPADPRPAPAATIGTSAEAEISLDLLAQPGGCTWTGPGAEAALRALLTSVLTAAERQRPLHPRVRALLPQDLAERLLPGLPTEFSALTQASDTTQAVRRAEEHLLAHARHAAREDEAELAGEAEESEPGTLLLLTRPDRAHTGQLQALANRSSPGVLIVLTLEEALPGASSWHISADGTTTANGPLCEHPHPLRLFQLTAQAAHEVLDMLLGAHGRHPRPRPVPTNHDPSEPHAAEHPDPSSDASSSETDPADCEPPIASVPAAPVSSPLGQRKPIRLHVLGPLAVHAQNIPEPVGTRLKTEAREFLTLLAAHPAGLLAADIAGNLRLDTNPDHVARDMKNLRRAVRRTLRGATGITHAEFILCHGDLHKLNLGLIETDLDDFRQALKEAASATTEAERTAAVHQALSHYRGPFAPGGDHLWADGIREHLANQICDAVLRLAHRAEHTGSQDEQDATLALLEQAVTHHPDNERLYAAAIRLHQAAGRSDAAHRTYLRLKRHLTQLGLEPDPAVRALLPAKASLPASA